MRHAVEQLATRLPLGIVTGRPRDEAEWFLRRFGIEDLFSTLVCLEDGPLKPDPAPVSLAMRRLEASRAWMIGDTPDDIRAAAGAGALALGVVAPGNDAPSTSTALMHAGAASVLEDLDSIGGVIA